MTGERLRPRAPWLLVVSRTAFSLFVLFACLSAWWTWGVFARPSLFSVSIAGQIYRVGFVTMLAPLAACTGLWAWQTLPQLRRRPAWGAAALVLAFGLLALLRAWPVHRLHTLVVAAMGVLVFWAVYAYASQVWTWSWAVGTMAALLMIQGAVAVAQFWRQGSIGLTALGELSLDPTVRGVSVVEVVGGRWLRAYGLTAHPNVLGGYLAVGILVCGGAWLDVPHRRWPLLPALGLGGLGLLVSLSRSAWLGLGAGLVYWALVTRVWRRIPWRSKSTRAALLAIVVVAIVLVVILAEPVAARVWRPASILERNSIEERLRDAGQAWVLIRQSPLTGVGTGYYADALWSWAIATGQEWPAVQHVHNVPLLAAAEMGIAGALLWLLLLGVPPAAVAWRAARMTISPAAAGWPAALVCLLVISLLDCYPYFLITWWMAFVLGVLLGIWSQVWSAWERS